MDKIKIFPLIFKKLTMPIYRQTNCSCVKIKILIVMDIKFINF